MEKLFVKRPAGPELMPWQAALMIVCVTVAGVLHERAGGMRPMGNSLQTTQGRSVVAQGSHPADALNVVVWQGR